MQLKPTRVIEHIKDPVGLGDLVAQAAQPIAKMLDAAMGTNIAGCGGCAQRQEKLNALLPDVRNPFRK